MGLDHWLYKNDEAIITWRKENHIHSWFVEHCDGGDNEEVVVPFETLKEFLDVCKVVLEKLNATPTIKKSVLMASGYENGKHYEKYGDIDVWPEEIVADILPTQAGFFFGSTEISQYYKQSIEEAIPIVEDLVKEHEEGDVYTYSSWW